MHKRLINELTLSLTLSPDGPLLVKAGDRGGADPTRPDMEFVRTWYNGVETVYLPGSSLKGMLRAHTEKIARTVAAAHPRQGQDRLTCNPLKNDARAPDGSCGAKLEQRKNLQPHQVFHDSCFVCRIFGNTALAAHLRITDAYPTADSLDAANRTEERHGVAIDRVYGSVAVGPFQLETATTGDFTTTLTLRNFTVAQLGLLGLTLRDLAQRRIAVGFAKSRGLGRVTSRITAATVRYPLGELLPGIDDGELVGTGALMHALEPAAAEEYGYSTDDRVPVPGLQWTDDGWGGRELALDSQGCAEGGPLDALWRAGVGAWSEVVRHG